MVNELAQVRVGGLYLPVLLGIALGLRGRPPFLLRGHLPGQSPEVFLVRVSAVQVWEQLDKAAIHHLGRLSLMLLPPCTVKPFGHPRSLPGGTGTAGLNPLSNNHPFG